MLDIKLLDTLIFNKSLKEILIAIAIILSFILLRKLFAKIIVGMLSVVVSKTKNTLDDQLLKISIEPIKLTLTVVGFYISINYLGIDFIFIDDIFRSIFTFIIFWIIYDIVLLFSNAIKNFAKKFGSDMHEEIGLFLIKTAKLSVIFIAIVAILEVWGINVSAFIASLGLGGLAFALAAKDTASNLFGGLTLLADKSLKMGDWIEVSNVEGVVETIGLRTTKIRTFEKSLITVPNQILANQPVENYSRRGIRRIKFRVGLTYDTSSEIIQNIVTQITTMLQNHPKIAQDATMLVRFDKFEDSSLSIFVYTFTSTANWAKYLEIKEDVNLKVMEIVEQNNAQFAFPSQSIYIEKGSLDD